MRERHIELGPRLGWSSCRRCRLASEWLKRGEHRLDYTRTIADSVVVKGIEVSRTILGVVPPPRLGGGSERVRLSTRVLVKPEGPFSVLKLPSSPTSNSNSSLLCGHTIRGSRPSGVSIITFVNTNAENGRCLSEITCKLGSAGRDLQWGRWVRD